VDIPACPGSNSADQAYQFGIRVHFFVNSLSQM
jgi:hypothetical protein